MRALVVLLLFSVACAAVVFSVLEWRKRSTPEAKRTDSIADLSRRAAAAAAEGRHAEAERLDYAAQRLLDGFGPGPEPSARVPGARRYPLDDFDDDIIRRAERVAEELRRRDSDSPVIPERLRERAAEARRKSQPRDDT